LTKAKSPARKSISPHLTDLLLGKMTLVCGTAFSTANSSPPPEAEGNQQSNGRKAPEPSSKNGKLHD
jgi:hypothetical protein